MKEKAELVMTVRSVDEESASVMSSAPCAPAPRASCSRGARPEELIAAVHTIAVVNSRLSPSIIPGA